VNQEFTQLTLDEWDRAYSINVRSAFLCMREAVKSMLETGGGRIVNVTTIGARHPVLHGNAAYSSSRAALNMLARNVALDYAVHGILCNTVMPGSIPGKIRIDEATMQSMQAGRAPSGPILNDAKRLPRGNGSADDIAAAVLYLAGPSGSYITGQELVVDGGFLLT
jgi:NAD(P)-dependent dehydrogenase (short-subunit alcohol dehydrogenase family)